MGHLDDCPFGIAVQQQIGLGVDQQRRAHLVLPVVVMGNAAQRGFNAAEDHRHILVRLTAALGIGHAGPVGPLASLAACGIGVVGADLAVGGIAVDHRVHVAGSDPEKQVRLAQLHEVVLALPVRLADDADAKTLGFQHPADDRHAEGRVVHIGVAGDDDHIAAVPAQQVHFLATHRQEGSWPETLGPVPGIVKQSPCPGHG